MSLVFSLMSELGFPNQRQRPSDLSHVVPLWACGMGPWLQGVLAGTQQQRATL